MKIAALSGLLHPLQMCVSFALVVTAARGGVDTMSESPWRLTGNYGGGYARGVRFCPTDPEVLYSVIDVTGPYRSDDGGRHWRPLAQNLDMAEVMNCADIIASLSVDPRDEDSFVFVSGNVWQRAAGTYFSRDGGLTFHHAAALRFKLGDYNRSGEPLARNPRNPDELVAASYEDGIFRSADNGETWTFVGEKGVPFCDVRYDRKVPGRVYASAPAEKGKSSGLYVSENGGRSFTRLAPEGPGEICQIDGDGRLVAIFGARDVRQSDDGGRTWTSFSEGLPVGQNEGGLSLQRGRFSALAAGRDFWLCSNGYGDIFRRERGDPAWRLVPRKAMRLSAPEQEQFSARRAAECRIMAPSSIEIDGRDDRHWFVTDWFDIWETRDAGATWTSRNVGIQQTVTETVACDPNDANIVIIGLADLGLLYSTNDCKSFSNPQAMSGCNSIAFSRRRKGVALLAGGKYETYVNITTDSGKTYARVKGAGLPKWVTHEVCAYSIACDPTTDDFYVTVSGGSVGPGAGGVYRTHDYGETWEWAGDGLPEGKSLYHNVEFGGAGRVEQIVFSSDGSALTFMRTGKVYRLDRKAGRWVACHPYFGGDVVADPFRPGRFLMGAADVFETTDGGVHWTQLTTCHRGMTHLAADAHVKGLFAAASDREVFVSRDGGAHWAVLKNGMRLPAGRDHEIRLDRGRLFFMTTGAGVWRADIASADAGGLDGTGWTSFPVNGGGYLQNVVIAPSDPNVWYSYVDISGPYRSDDAGRNWHPLGQNLTTKQRRVFADFVRSISVDPETPETFVMVSGDRRSPPAGVYVTVDGGRHFKRTLVARFDGEDVLRGRGLGDALVRDPTDANVLLAAAESEGVYRSEDRGLTWKKCAGFGKVRPTDIRYDRNDPKVVYLSSQTASLPGFETGFYRSEDGGQTWKKTSEMSPFRVAQLLGHDELVGLVPGPADSKTQRVVISHDRGSTWTDFHQGLPGVTRVYNGCRAGDWKCIDAGPDFWLVSDGLGNLCRRTFGAAAWSPVSVEDMQPSFPDEDLGGEMKNKPKGVWPRMAVSRVIVDERDPRHWLTTDWHQTWETLDAGRTWRTAYRGIRQLVPFTVSCDPNSADNVVYGCADVGMHVSNDGCRSFTHGTLSSGLNCVAWCQRPEHRGIAIGTGAKVGLQLIITRDGGRTWSYLTHDGRPELKGLPKKLGQKEGEHAAYSVAVDPTTDDIYLTFSGRIAPGEGGVYRSHDLGQTWEWAGQGMDSATEEYFKGREFEGECPGHWAEEIVFSSDGSALVYGTRDSEGSMYRRDVKSDRWVPFPLKNFRGKATIAADPFAPGRFVFAAPDGGLVEILDGGRKIAGKIPGGEGAAYSIAFDPHIRGLAATVSRDGGELWLSHDGARTFSVVKDGMHVPGSVWHKLFLDRGRVFMLTRGSGVWMRIVEP